MLKVFTDFHHASLLQSLIILFEKRLGGSIYRPIGMDWATRGYWKVYDHPATQLQFLTTDQAYKPIDGTPPLNQIINTKTQPDIYGTEQEVFYCHDIDSDQLNKAITFDGFMSLPIDIVIASIPQHIEPFKRLCELHPNKPRLIFQIGNAWTVEAGLAPNVMASAKINNVPDNVHFISYHQEFDLDQFRYIPNMVPANNIYSFVNVFGGQDHFASDWQLFQETERTMPEWSFKSFGGQCRDGAIGPTPKLADKMREARFIWHTKQGGDGYGHIIHNVAAVGRPMVAKRSYYEGKFGGELMIDGQTCVAIDGLSVAQIKEKIEHYNEPGRYAQLCQNTYENFKKVVDFDREAEELKKFLRELV